MARTAKSKKSAKKTEVKNLSSKTIRKKGDKKVLPTPPTKQPVAASSMKTRSSAANKSPPINEQSKAKANVKVRRDARMSTSKSFRRRIPRTQKDDANSDSTTATTSKCIDTTSKSADHNETSSVDNGGVIEEIAAKPKQSDDASEVEMSGGGRSLKIMTWNVAGLRALVKNDHCRFITSNNADIVLLQETKCPEIPDNFPSKGFQTFISQTPDKVGYAGVVLLSKQKPLTVTTKLDDVPEDIDVEGRLIVAEYEKFFLINAYVPNSGRGLVNLGKRKQWDAFFFDYIQKLDAVKPVIYGGDLNVAHQEIDLANPKTNRNKTAGFTDQERDDFTRLLNAGFVDVYRYLNPDKKDAYTFWSRVHNARATNTGWRLDYLVVSERLKDKIIKCEINSKVLGSDHCPVTLHINI